MELIQAAPATIGAGGPAPVSLTAPMRVLLDAFGSINRALDRTLLNFKTGDLTFVVDNRDGFFDALFEFLSPSDRWTLRVLRRGGLQFTGVVLGQGSIRFLRLEKNVEITAYGPPKILDDASAEVVARILGPFTYTSGGGTSLTINSTTGLLPGDVLHITDQANKEDVVIRQVTSATQLTLEAALINGYAAGSPVTCTSPYYRFKSIDFLVRRLFESAGIAVAQVLTDLSQFSSPAPTPVNINKLSVADRARAAGCERNGRVYVTVRNSNTYYQVNPEDDWTQEDATDKAWVDWSRYYKTDETPPSIILRAPVSGDDSTDPRQNWRGYCDIWGWNYKAGTKRLYFIERDNTAGNGYFLSEQTSADGVTWSAINRIGAALVGVGDIPSPHVPRYTEYDPARDLVFMCWADQMTPKNNFKYYDVGAGLPLVDCKQGDDATTHGYWGPVYVPDRDYVIVLRGNGLNGFTPNWEICAFRKNVRLWKRPFPSILVKEQTGQANPTEPTIHPTITLREFQGVQFCVAIIDGAAQLVWSEDEWLSYSHKKLSDSTTITRFSGSVVLGHYRTFSYRGTIPKDYEIYAPFYAGIVSYADHSGLSVAQALANLAVIANAAFWVDDDLQGHFVARDLLPAGEIFDASALVQEQNEVAIWDQTYQYVSLAGSGVDVTSGVKAFASQGITINSPLLPNEAFSQLLCDQYYTFYSKKRALVESVLHDRDGHIYRPLDRVNLGGPSRYMVYESDHALPSDEVTVTLLEDV